MTPGGRAPLQTFHALQATDLASACNDALKRMRIEPGNYALEMTVPEGPSTAGGVQALQHLRLVPGAAGFPTLVVGHANHADGHAELRTFDHVDAIHRTRFKRPLDLDRARYDECMTLARHVLEALHLQTAVVGPPADIGEPPESGPRPRQGSAATAVVFLASLAALAAAAAGIWRFVHPH